MVLIVVSKEAKANLASLKQHPRETYGDVVDRLIQKNRFDSTTKESIGEIMMSVP